MELTKSSTRDFMINDEEESAISASSPEIKSLDNLEDSFHLFQKGKFLEASLRISSMIPS